MEYNKDRNYIFILCPPFQGSTAIYRLLETSPETSTFLNKVEWMGEGQNLLAQSFRGYQRNKWDPDFSLQMAEVSRNYHKNWDLNKRVLIDKSPPTICRAQMFEEEFSKYGNVHFIVQIRNPLFTKFPEPPSTMPGIFEDTKGPEVWDVMAQCQKDNLESLKSVYFLTYEKLCTETDTVIKELLEKFPFLGSLNPEKMNDASYTSRYRGAYHGARGQGLHFVKEPRGDTKKRKEYFKKNNELFDYFGFELEQ